MLALGHAVRLLILAGGLVGAGFGAPALALAQFSVADLGITKSAPATVESGNYIIYGIAAANNGPDPADNVVVSDTLPSGVNFYSMLVPPGWNCITPAVFANGTITCSISTMAVGSVNLDVTTLTDSALASGTSLSNTVTITSSTPEGNPGDESSTAVTTTTISADVSLTISASPDPVVAGENLTYQINVDSAGYSDAQTVSFSDTLPAGTTFASLSAPIGWSCTTPSVGTTGTVTCGIATAPAGTSYGIVLVVTVDAKVASGTVLSNTATASSATADPVIGNESGTTTTTVSSLADVSVTKVDTPEPVVAGDNITYTVTVTNSGPSVASNVTLTDALPAATTFVSLSAPAWSCTTPAVGANGTVNCSLASMAVGSSVLTLTAAVDPGFPGGGSVTNTAAVASTTSDPDSGNDSSTAATTVVARAADLSITKTAAPDPVAPGGAIAYTITVSNTGPDAAPATTVTDALPASVSFVSATPTQGSCSGTSTVTCTLGTLTSGGTATVTINAVADAGAPAGTVISNTAAVSGAATDSNPANDASTASVTVAAAGVASTTTTLTSSANPSTVGDAVSFTAMVASERPGTPTGAVTFSVDGIAQPPVALSGRTAIFTTAALSAGSHDVVAVYGGDASFSPSTSTTVTQSVGAFAGSVVIRQQVAGMDGTFGFTSPTTALNVDVTTTGGTGESGAIEVPAGAHMVTASDMSAAGIGLTSINCDDTDSSANPSTRTAAIVVAAGETVTCTFTSVDSRSKATEMIDNFLDTRAALIVGNQSDVGDRIDRLNGLAPSPGNPASALMGLMPLMLGDPVTVSGSLGAIDAAMGNEEPSRFDIWFEGTFALYDKTGLDGTFGLGKFGADYLVTDDLLVGALFEVDTMAQTTSLVDPGVISGTGWLAGPYLTARLMDNLYLDLLAAGGTSSNEVSPFGTYSDTFSATRFLLSATLTGQWTGDGWTFSPEARASYFQETSDAYVDSLGVTIPAVTSGLGQLAAGPSVSYRFVTEGEITVDTGIKLLGMLDIHTGAGATGFENAHGRVEANLGLGLSGGARLGVSVAYDGIGSTDLTSIGGTVKLTAPIN